MLKKIGSRLELGGHRMGWGPRVGSRQPPLQAHEWHQLGRMEGWQLLAAGCPLGGVPKAVRNWEGRGSKLGVVGGCGRQAYLRVGTCTRAAMVLVLYAGFYQ